MATISSTSLSPNPMIHVSFNQDAGRFAVGTDGGFRIYNCDPFREIFRRDFDFSGGISKVEMLFGYNIFALVGDRHNSQFPQNKVMIWDDHHRRCIVELSFRSSEVRGLRLRRDRIVVALEHKIFVYDFTDFKLLSEIETMANPMGLCTVSQGASFVLACPSVQKGEIKVEHYSSKRTMVITAHHSNLACLTLSPDGQMLVTASTKGTLVRIFNAFDGTLLQEVRRGADRAEIYSLAFSQAAQFLAVSSCKGTVHIFRTKNGHDIHDRSETEYSTSFSSLSYVKGILMPKYFSSEWSVAQFHLPEGCRYMVAFGHEKDTVVIVGNDGSFYRCKFDPFNGGEMTRMEHHNFLKPDESL